MARRVILDTGILIAIEHGRLSFESVLGRDDPAIAAVSAMELLMGVERTHAAWRARQKQAVEIIVTSLPVVDYTLAVARVHARIAAASRRAGHAWGACDLVVAATAAATDRLLLTTDTRADFSALPGVRAEVVPVPRGA